MSSPANDPRQPSAAKPYKPLPVAPQDLPIDYSGFIAVIFGVFGAMFRVRTLLNSVYFVPILDNFFLFGYILGFDYKLDWITGHNSHPERRSFLDLTFLGEWI